MASNSQIEANRKNAKHSQGPVTEEGKTASSRNSFQHGLTASPMSMMPGEDPQDFMTFRLGVIAEHKPATITEDALVTKMVEALWLSARAVKLQQKIVFDPKYSRTDFELYMRYQVMHDRAFSRYLSDLIKLRKEAREQQIGFVSQQEKQRVDDAKIRNLNARSAEMESTTQARTARLATSPASAHVSQKTFASPSAPQIQTIP